MVNTNIVNIRHGREVKLPVCEGGGGEMNDLGESSDVSTISATHRDVVAPTAM